MRFNSLQAWLDWQEGLHPNAIDLGLERLARVADRMALGRPAPVVITVGGTNGKGSTCAFLEAILRAEGYRVGLYTSPHLLRYTERIRIDGAEVEPATLCQAFERIDQARAEISLTYFEFGTLAALDIFAQAGLDIALLEVGMGGRLDAVNLVDADVAVVTGIDLDHTQWLGEDREAIGREKAGIFRPGRGAVCADPNPPASLLAIADALPTRLLRWGKEFRAIQTESGWCWEGEGRPRADLPLPTLRGEIQLRNASAALMALELLADRLPISQAAVRHGLVSAAVAGRFQVISGATPVVLDVAHNRDASTQLAATLARFTSRPIHAVVGMLADKAVEATLAPLASLVSHWYPLTLGGERGADAQQITAALSNLGATERIVASFADVASALASAQEAAEGEGVVLVFGSFLTVGAALTQLSV